MRSFRLRNCGFGCAVNVKVAPVETDRYAADFGKIESRFEPVDYLPSGERADVDVSTYANGEKLEGTPFEHWFHPSFPGQEAEIKLAFEDVEGRRYEVRTVIAEEFNRARLPRKIRIGAIEEINA